MLTNRKGVLMDIKKFWKAVLKQDEKEIRKYFHDDASIYWHCTNEHFTLDDYMIANCEYPGDWDGVIERIEMRNDDIITVTLVYPKNKTYSFHVVSFLKIKQDKIIRMDEYWAGDDDAPQWRLDKHIGKPIK